MRLVHISDLHFGAIGTGLPDQLRSAIMQMAPTLLAISGDLTMRGRREEFSEARAFLESLPLPMLVVPGNHDVQGHWNFWERFLSPWSNYRTAISSEMEPVWRAPGLIVGGLNSARPAGWYLDWSRGRPKRTGLMRLAETFASEDQHVLRVLVVHHPPAAPPHGMRRHLIGRLDEFTQAVRKAQVDVILSGHFHMSYAQVLPLTGDHGTASCVLSSVSTATSHRLKGEPNGFHVIEGNDMGLQIADWAWNGSSYQRHRGWAFERDADIRLWRQVAA